MIGEYPTDAELAAVTAAPTPQAALDIAAELWSVYGSVNRELSAHEGYIVHAAKEDRYLRLATGGWSGNESLIGALQSNRIAWLMTWQMSARGGLHIFRYPSEAV